MLNSNYYIELKFTRLMVQCKPEVKENSFRTTKRRSQFITITKLAIQNSHTQKKLD